MKTLIKILCLSVLWFSCEEQNQDIHGCLDSQACNYNSNANTENGSCMPFVYGCTDEDALNYDALANTDDNTCIDYVYGCTDPEASNYDESANVDDGSCEHLLVDINGDGILDILDIILIVNIVISG